MPKDADRRDLTRDEIEKKKFETFFTTSVAQVPEEMIPHAAQPDRKHGLLSRFFAKKEKARSQDPPEQEEVLWAETPIAPTGEIMLDRPGQPSVGFCSLGVYCIENAEQWQHAKADIAANIAPISRGSRSLTGRRFFKMTFSILCKSDEFINPSFLESIAAIIIPIATASP